VLDVQLRNVSDEPVYPPLRVRVRRLRAASRETLSWSSDSGAKAAQWRGRVWDFSKLLEAIAAGTRKSGVRP